MRYRERAFTVVLLFKSVNINILNQENAIDMDTTLERIDNLMHEQKKQYKELNEYLGVGKTTYAAWKNGMSKSYFKHIDEIALFLGVSPNYLIDGQQEKTNSENVC